jgi:DNA (cytosine-5)-methyltransferase 1
VGSLLSRREQETRREVGQIGLLIGGPPCQGNSNLNNHTRWADRKNALYMRMVRAVEVLEPAMVVIENVPGVRKDVQRVLHRAARRLTDLGYYVAEGTVAVSELGVAQLRVRHVLIASAHRPPQVTEIVEAHRVEPARSLRWALTGLPSPDSDGPMGVPSRLSPANQLRARWLLDNHEYDLPNDRRPSCHRDPNHKYKSMYGRLRWDRPAQTITTGFGSPGQGRYLHPEEPRTVTPREAARIQFFPDWFNFNAADTRTALAQCIGNAVPPKLSFVLVRALLGSMRGSVHSGKAGSSVTSALSDSAAE